jgi:hypothetical protein
MKTTLCIKINDINVRIEPSTAAGGSTDATYGIAVDVDIDASFLKSLVNDAVKSILKDSTLIDDDGNSVEIKTGTPGVIGDVNNDDDDDDDDVGSDDDADDCTNKLEEEEVEEEERNVDKDDSDEDGSRSQNLLETSSEDDDSVRDLPGDGYQEGGIDVMNEFEVMDNLSQQINTMFLRHH